MTDATINNPIVVSYKQEITEKIRMYKMHQNTTHLKEFIMMSNGFHLKSGS